MSPVGFKKRLCRPVDFRDQGPYEGSPDVSNVQIFVKDSTFDLVVLEKCHGHMIF